MSYARFGWDGSDVYVYLSVGGFFDCCGCWLGEKLPGAIFHESQRFDSTGDVLAHLREHQAAGHCVPPDTFERLEAEREENDAWIAGGGEEWPS